MCNMHNHCNAQSLQRLQWQQWIIKSNVHCVISATFTPACKKWLHVACVALNDVHQWCPPLMSTTDVHQWTELRQRHVRETGKSNTDELFDIFLTSKVVKFPNAICVNTFARNSPKIHLFCQMHSPKGGRSMGAKIGQRPHPPANSVSWTPADACAQFLPPLKPKLFDTYQDGTVHS